MAKEKADTVNSINTVAETHFKCDSCGSDMKFSPGTFSQKCPHCRHTVTLERNTDTVRELNFIKFLAESEQQQATEETRTSKCPSCGAEIAIDEKITSTECPYCSTSMVTSNDCRRRIKPQSLLPFKITCKEGKELFSKWINSLWLAPNKLKKLAYLESGLKGVYVPYWTYDCSTHTAYTGERGEDYWDTEHYTAHENGKTVHKTRQVRKTRWYSASGDVNNNFDDVLVLASNSFPAELAEDLEPWDLNELNSFDEAFLSGFESEKYQIGLDEGFVLAQAIMDNPIRASICRDIGGDHQRIHSMQSEYSNIMFKHILLPVWICSYKYQEKLYQIMINARTGEVQGERPWSSVKIAILVVIILAIVSGIILAFTG